MRGDRAFDAIKTGSQWANFLSVGGVFIGIGISAYSAFWSDINAMVFVLTGWAAALAIAISSHITITKAFSFLHALAKDHSSQAERIADLTSENRRLIDISDYIASHSIVGSNASTGATPRGVRPTQDMGQDRDH